MLYLSFWKMAWNFLYGKNLAICFFHSFLLSYRAYRLYKHDLPLWKSVK